MAATFSSAFLRGEAGAAQFLAGDFRDAAARARAVQQAAARQRPVPEALLAVLRAQAQGLPASAARDGHLDDLARPGTVVVVTGQQLGLFLGPLFTFYKAATAVALAQVVARESGARCVPVTMV